MNLGFGFYYKNYCHYFTCTSKLNQNILTDFDDQCFSFSFLVILNSSFHVTIGLSLFTLSLFCIPRFLAIFFNSCRDNFAWNYPGYMAVEPVDPVDPGTPGYNPEVGPVEDTPLRGLVAP